MVSTEEEFSAAWERIVAQAWSDDGFKQRLLAQPGSVFSDFGISTPPGATVRVVENTPMVKTMVLPMPPSSSVTEVGAGDAPMGFPCWTF